MNNMNGPDLPPTPATLVPPSLNVETSAAAGTPFDGRHWFTRLLATNPFYLISAALLLYGIYRVSVDPALFAGDRTQLEFNFGSLQFYEILLAGTAILLARRRVWYDATLLVCLENALLFVPFILISQAALMEQHWVWGYCGAAVTLVIARTTALKTWFQNLNLPARLLSCGGIVLAVNAALPVIFRQLHESKVGTKPTEGAAYDFNLWSWLALLPALIACINLLPRPGAGGGAAPRSRWLPPMLFALWLAATITHLYSLGYVYDFDLHRNMIAPALVMLSWTLNWRITDVVTRPGEKTRRALLIAPLVTPMVAGFTNNATALAIAAFNVIVYGLTALLGARPRLARNLAVVSLLMVIGAIPHQWGGVLVPGFSPAKAVAVAALAGLILPALLSRNPKLGFLGALAVAAGVGALGGPGGRAVNWGVQAGCVFFLLHSLRWLDWREKGLPVARGLGAALWLLHSFAWVHHGGPGLGLAAMGLVVLAAWAAARYWGRVRGLRWVGVVGGLVMVSRPLDALGGWVATAPAGLLAVAGSFALFALGTAVALTKQRWHRPAENRESH